MTRAILLAMSGIQVKGTSVLVVEDHADVRYVMQKLLEFDGFHVLAAAGGVEALGLVSQHGMPAVVITDMHMPEMDGETFLHALDRHIASSPEPVTRPLIIICTAAILDNRWVGLADRVITKCSDQFLILSDVVRESLAARSR
jgi:CheY-like chemotaxis protein